MINEASSLGSSPEDKSDQFDRAIAITGGSWGKFQILSSLSFWTLFSVGSQFFYSIPFY